MTQMTDAGGDVAPCTDIASQDWVIFGPSMA